MIIWLCCYSVWGHFQQAGTAGKKATPVEPREVFDAPIEEAEVGPSGKRIR